VTQLLSNLEQTEMLQAISDVHSGKAARISSPGKWRVHRCKENQVVSEALLKVEANKT